MGEAYQQAARKVKRSRKVRSFLALASVFVMLVTSLSLMNQADTMEWEPVACALEEHVHTEDCYAWVTDHEETEDVTAEIRTLSCTFQPHVHTALCAVGGGWIPPVAWIHGCIIPTMRSATMRTETWSAPCLN